MFLKLDDGTYLNMENLSTYSVQGHTRGDGTTDAEVVIRPGNPNAAYKLVTGMPSVDEAQSALDAFMTDIGFKTISAH